MTTTPHFLHAASLADLRKTGLLTVQLGGHTIALFEHAERVYAVDNRCPHMGFPLDKGTVRQGILTCYWHYARFDLASGGAFDLWADDVRAFPVEVRAEAIYVDVALHYDPRRRQQERLAVGLERDLPLVIGKAMMTLLDSGDEQWSGDPVPSFRTGLLFGTKYRERGWGQGLTIHVSMMNLLPHLAPEDRPRALYHGLAAVARDSAGHAPLFCVPSLPGHSSDLGQLKAWFRQFIEVRDAEGAERCVVSALRAGADHRQMADMLFAAATDHRYIDVGHPLDFTNKAFEALDIIGWDAAETVLPSLVMGYTSAMRMEESNAWRYPVDLVALLEGVFAQLSTIALADGETAHQPSQQDALVQTLLADDPFATVAAMLAVLREGWPLAALAQTVAYAAALRIARFHTSNEFGDWDTALHTFTFANAVHQGLRRAPSPELLRGVFDAAMSIYLDRFLNIPAARLPTPNGQGQDAARALQELTALLDRQQQVNPSAQTLAHFLYGGGKQAALLAHVGKLLLREDRDFHTIQAVEAAFRQYDYLRDQPEGVHVLVAAVRYLAAHAPTVRAQGQTFEIARRLHRDERLFEGE
ncbi:MAG: Rieske (2Fe-2S) protein [Caldilineaceae bacterium]|nr:Rieske (2Fe-2S) protein [Caldilineaceae bacterium]